jgi:hypothetical protein
VKKQLDPITLYKLCLAAYPVVEAIYKRDGFYGPESITVEAA